MEEKPNWWLDTKQVNEYFDKMGFTEKQCMALADICELLVKNVKEHEHNRIIEILEKEKERNGDDGKWALDCAIKTIKELQH